MDGVDNDCEYGDSGSCIDEAENVCKFGDGGE